jgi:zinc protease
MRPIRLSAPGPAIARSLAALLLVLAPAPARAQASLESPLPVDPAVTVGTLENGLRYYVRAHGEPRARAELRLVVNAGSVLEDEDQRGLAHFLEHMAFNGTENFERQELVNYLESIGMRFGPDLNAYTSFDETVYMLQLPTDDPELLATGLQILEEWAHRIVLDAEEVERERGVILEEWRLGRGAQSRVLERQIPVIFSGSPYAERLPIGDTAVIRGAPASALQRFYEDWYRPDLMAVVAVGDFDAAEVEAQIRERFSAIPPHPTPRPRPQVGVPGHDETLFAIVTDPELQITQISVAYKQPSRPEATLGAYRRSLVEALYNAMLNFRLQELTRAEDPPFLGAASVQGRIIREGELYQLAAAVQPGGVGRGLETLLQEAERVRRFGFTASELTREKDALVRQYQQALDERETRRSATLADEYVSNFLTREPIPGIETEFQLVQALLPTIGLQEVDALAEAWITDRNRVILASVPDRAGPPPTEGELLQVFERARAAEITAYAEAEAVESLMDPPPAPGRIVAEEVVEELDTRIWTLENGARVLVKATDFQDDEILFQAWGPGGISLAPYDLLIPARTATAVLGQGGLGDLSLTDLQRALSGKAASVSPSIGELSQGMSGAASPRDVETLFQLIHLHFTAPRADPAAFQALRGQFSAILANRDASPQAHFQDTVSVTMAQGHPRARPISPEDPGLMDLQASLDFYRRRFADAANFTFVFVGTLDPESLRPLVEQYIGSLPSEGRRESWQDDGVRPPEGIIRKVVRKGMEPQSATQILFTGEAEYTARNRDLLGALAEALQIRLRETLREELGGTYSVSVSGRVVAEPRDEYTVAIAFGSAPERAEELVAAVTTEIAAMQQAGPTEEDLVKVKEAHRRARELGQRQNAYWVGQLLNWDRYDLDPERITAPSLYEGLTTHDIQEAAKQFLRMDNVVVVTLLPEGEARE